MVVIDGKNYYTVTDLEHLQREFKQDQLLICVFTDDNGVWQERPIYKHTEDAAETEVYFYLGDNRSEKKVKQDG